MSGKHAQCLKKLTLSTSCVIESEVEVSTTHFKGLPDTDSAVSKDVKRCGRNTYSRYKVFECMQVKITRLLDAKQEKRE